jgi:hypothetical protein
MKYLVLYESSKSIYTGDGRTSVDTLGMAPFEDSKEAVAFCKEKNGYIVKALDLVLETEQVDE